MKPKIQRNLAPGRKKDDTVNLNQLPGKPSPYKLEAGEGMRYVIGRHLATVIARAEDLGVAMAGTILSGSKGAHFPLHSHQSTHEAMFVLEGDVSLTLGNKVFELSPGDYVNIPPGTPHAFTYLDHRGKLVAWTFGGNANTLYAALGQPYEGTVYSESSADIDWGRAVDGVDVQFVDHGSDLVASTAKLEAAPEGAVPFVLRGGEGERMLAGEQLYTLMGMAHNSDGLFHSLMTEGPKGPMIPKHMHEKTCETFFCLSGGMEMLVGDEAISLAPGDFLYIPCRRTACVPAGQERHSLHGLSDAWELRAVFPLSLPALRWLHVPVGAPTVPIRPRHPAPGRARPEAAGPSWRTTTATTRCSRLGEIDGSPTV